jgi:hypothetical protein
VFCGTGAAGGSCAQLAIASIPNKTLAMVSWMFRAKRANGIHSSPFIKTLRPCKKDVKTKDVVADVTSSDLPGRYFDSVIDTQLLIRNYPYSGSRKMPGSESLQKPAATLIGGSHSSSQTPGPRLGSSEPQIYVLKQFKRG